MPRNTSEVFLGGVARRDIALAHVNDPRDSGRVLGAPVTMGEEVQLDPDFPGWKITTFTFDDKDGTQDGCVFEVAAGTETPIGVVGMPKGHSEGDPYPYFEEFGVRGSAVVLLGTDHSTQIRRVEPGNGSLLYGPPTRVLYLATKREPFVGVNIGRPGGIPETTVGVDDRRVPESMKTLYKRMQNPQPTQP